MLVIPLQATHSIHPIQATTVSGCSQLRICHAANDANHLNGPTRFKWVRQDKTQGVEQVQVNVPG